MLVLPRQPAIVALLAPAPDSDERMLKQLRPASMSSAACRHLSWQQLALRRLSERGSPLPSLKPSSDPLMKPGKSDGVWTSLLLIAPLYVAATPLPDQPGRQKKRTRNAAFSSFQLPNPRQNPMTKAALPADHPKPLSPSSGKYPGLKQPPGRVTSHPKPSRQYNTFPPTKRARRDPTANDLPAEGKVTDSAPGSTGNALVISGIGCPLDPSRSDPPIDRRPDVGYRSSRLTRYGPVLLDSGTNWSCGAAHPLSTPPRPAVPSPDWFAARGRPQGPRPVKRNPATQEQAGADPKQRPPGSNTRTE